MSCSLKHHSAVCRVLEATGTRVANSSTIRILETIVLNAIIQFLISNRDIVVVEEQWCANCQGLKANARELTNKTFYVQEGSITL